MQTTIDETMINRYLRLFMTIPSVTGKVFAGFITMLAQQYRLWRATLHPVQRHLQSGRLP